jgi:hypothetical protein
MAFSTLEKVRSGSRIFIDAPMGRPAIASGDQDFARPDGIALYCPGDI